MIKKVLFITLAVLYFKHGVAQRVINNVIVFDLDENYNIIDTIMSNNRLRNVLCYQYKTDLFNKDSCVLVSRNRSGTLISLGQNGGNWRGMDVFDIANNTIACAMGLTNFSAALKVSGLNALGDFTPFGEQGSTVKTVFSPNGKTVGQAVLDFNFGLMGESVKLTYGTLGGTNEMVNTFIDLITGNVGAAAVDAAAPKQ